MIYTTEQIEWEVSQIGGTWVKKKNLRYKLKKKSNDQVCFIIDEVDKEIRKLKVNSGLKEQELILFYSFKSKLSRRLL